MTTRLDGNAFAVLVALAERTDLLPYVGKIGTRRFSHEGIEYEVGWLTNADETIRRKARQIKREVAASNGQAALEQPLALARAWIVGIDAGMADAARRGGLFVLERALGETLLGY